MKKNDIARLLPQVLQECLTEYGPDLGQTADQQFAPLDTLLYIAEIFTDPINNHYDYFSNNFDPFQCPHRFVPFLAAWMNVEEFVNKIHVAAGSEPARLSQTESKLNWRSRRLIEVSVQLARRRGTGESIITILETLLGMKGFRLVDVMESNYQPKPFHQCLVCPEKSLSSLELIQSVVQREKPAYVSVEINFGSSIFATSSGQIYLPPNVKIKNVGNQCWMVEDDGWIKCRSSVDDVPIEFETLPQGRNRYILKLKGVEKYVNCRNATGAVGCYPHSRGGEIEIQEITRGKFAIRQLGREKYMWLANQSPYCSGNKDPKSDPAAQWVFDFVD